jgi:hypothetical protein
MKYYQHIIMGHIKREDEFDLEQLNALEFWRPFEGHHELQLMGGITATVSYQDHMQIPFWVFGYEDDEKRDAGEGEYYQVCLLSSTGDPKELLYQGIWHNYLEEPLDLTERVLYQNWKAEHLTITDSDDDFLQEGEPDNNQDEY